MYRYFAVLPTGFEIGAVLLCPQLPHSIAKRSGNIGSLAVRKSATSFVTVPVRPLTALSSRHMYEYAPLPTMMMAIMSSASSGHSSGSQSASSICQLFAHTATWDRRTKCLHNAAASLPLSLALSLWMITSTLLKVGKAGDYRRRSCVA